MRPIASFMLLLALMSALSLSAADNRGLDPVLINRIQGTFDAVGYSPATINAVTNNDIKALSLSREKVCAFDNLFNVRLKSTGITNQAGSGRCWLFAGLNCFSPGVCKKLDLSKFEFSQPYLAFWDKMEKANFFLEEIIRLRERPLYDRELMLTLEGPFGDGGWWHYATSLIEKYGVVPITAMPESKQSSNTGTVNFLAERKLRSFAAELRRAYAEGASENQLRQRKEQMLAEIYQLLVFAYGRPPKEFVYRYKVNDSTITEPKTYTPKSFYDEFIGGPLPEYAVLMNNPAKGYDSLYQIEGSRNMADREDLTMLNLSIDALKDYCLKALLDSQAVWFACDVGVDNFNDSGVFRLGIYDFASTLGISFDIAKADRITLGDSYPNHAMTLVGVDTAADGTPTKWLVANSWGEKPGDDGYWTMYNDWFDMNVYLAVVRKDLLSDADRKKLDQKPTVLPSWDPFYQAAKRIQ